MKTQRTVISDGTDFGITLYDPQINPDESFKEWSAEDERITKEAGIKTRSWRSSEGRPERLLETYGPSDIVISHAYDNYVSWEAAGIVKTHARDGKHAMHLMEVFLNSSKPLARLTGYQLFRDIPFSFTESTEGSRTLYLVTGFDHPQFMYRGRNQLFVTETRSL